jgi:predicted peptidase
MKKLLLLALALAALFLGSLDQLHSQNIMNNQPSPAQKIPDPLAPDYQTAPRQKWETKFDGFQFKVLKGEGHTLPYRFYQPAPLEPGRKYPLVLFFHGAGERGLDNRYQFFRFRDVTNFWAKYPCFIIAPQCPPRVGDQDGESTWVQTGFGAPRHTMKAEPSWPMRLAMQLLDKTIAENPIDTHRVYVTGLSMGGFATWEILQREPNRFAAAVPVCGGADLAFAPRLAPIPIWVFHGSADTTVQPRRSRDMVAALTAAGGHPIYTEFPGVGHGAWTPTYSDMLIWDWMFAQSQVHH